MKNLLTTSILIATLFATVHSNASGHLSKDLSPLAKGKTALTLVNVESGNLLSIKDSNGLILYKERIESAGTYRKGFDLTALPDGNYFFELNKDLQIKTIPFSVTRSIVSFKKDKTKTLFKPYVRHEGSMVYISKLALNEEPLKVNIYSNLGDMYQLAYTEVIKGTKTIGKAYKLKKGNYKIILSSNDQEFTTFINN